MGEAWTRSPYRNNKCEPNGRLRLFQRDFLPIRLSLRIPRRNQSIRRALGYIMFQRSQDFNVSRVEKLMSQIGHVLIQDSDLLYDGSKSPTLIAIYKNPTLSSRFVVTYFGQPKNRQINCSYTTINGWTTTNRTKSSTSESILPFPYKY